jgi:hypothetical protein
MTVRILQVLVVAAVIMAASAAFGQASPIESATDLPIWKTVTIGQHRGVDAIRNALDDARIVIGDAADEIMGRPAFSYAGEPRELHLVVLAVAALGFGRDGATLADIHARALRLGLALCPEEVGPQLRLQYLDQPVGQFLHLAMKPQRNYGGDPIDFTLANSGAGLALLGGEARPETVLAGSVNLVFVRPSEQQVWSVPAPSIR